MEPTTQPENRSPENNPNVQRMAVYLIVTAIAFFAAGYGIAWFSFTTGADAQAAALESTVREAVADALDDVAIAEAAPQEEAAPAEPTIYDVSVDDDPSIGPEDAEIVIVEFSDFRCPYCARFNVQTLEPLMEQYDGRIRLVYRDFPVVGGENAALASECADDQGLFWEYHDLLFENQSALTSNDALLGLAEGMDGVDMETFTTCLETQEHQDEIDADFADGLSYGVRGTPAFFVNGHPIVGAQPLAAFVQVIEEVLAEDNVG